MNSKKKNVYKHSTHAFYITIRLTNRKLIIRNPNAAVRALSKIQTPIKEMRRAAHTKAMLPPPPRRVGGKERKVDAATAAAIYLLFAESKNHVT